MPAYHPSVLDPITEELRLILASLIKEQEFEWQLADEQAEQAWESTLSDESDLNESTPLVLPDYSLRLSPLAYLHVQYTTPTTPIYSINAPSISSIDHTRLDAELVSQKAELQGDEYPVFNIYTSLRSYLTSNPLSEPLPRISEKSSRERTDGVEPIVPELTIKCTLLWSHHLLATGKRKNIVQWSTELGLWGISKPGYPGVIVIEGLESDVDEFVHRIKQLNWKALQVRCESLGESLPPAPETVAAPARHDWALRNYAKLAKVLEGDVIRVREVEGMNQVAELMKKAGLEDVFKSALKL